MNTGPSVAMHVARTNVVPILNDRQDGLSCRAIAEKHGIPEHAIWRIMKETGYDGSFHAKPVRVSKAQRRKFQHLDVIREVEAFGDFLVIERSADEEGWIVTIDDLSGDQKKTIEEAMRSAYFAWAGNKIDT